MKLGCGYPRLLTYRPNSALLRLENAVMYCNALLRNSCCRLKLFTSIRACFHDLIQFSLALIVFTRAILGKYFLEFTSGSSRCMNVSSA